MGFGWTQGDSVKECKSNAEHQISGELQPYGLRKRHDVASTTGVMTIRHTVNAVAGESRNISVNAAGEVSGLNGTLPRRVTMKPPKPRSYAHFDAPLNDKQLECFHLSPNQVAKHSFFPLLGYEKITRKIDFSVFPPEPKTKPRAIRYASHVDSAIYSAYAQILSTRYEALLAELSIESVVLAYRGGIGYNVPFARSLIEEIKERGSCHVICLDLSKFFDTIPHKLIKETICTVMGFARLPADWFKIFTRLTKFEYVLREDIEVKLGKLKGRRVCGIATFRDVVRPLIKTNPHDYGIPQGTPLSGLIANVAMIDLDLRLHRKILALGGSYRRYSDDIAIVLPNEELEAEVLSFATDCFSEHGLSFNSSKTCKTTFSLAEAGREYTGNLLQYLGFTYNGSKVLIRAQSVKAFYARMKRNIETYIRSAVKRKVPIIELRKRVLIGRFTHWGDNRNFVQYAYRAAKEMKAPEIKHQLRNHVPIFDRHWTQVVNKYSDR